MSITIKNKTGALGTGKLRIGDPTSPPTLGSRCGQRKRQCGRNGQPTIQTLDSAMAVSRMQNNHSHLLTLACQVPVPDVLATHDYRGSGSLDTSIDRNLEVPSTAISNNHSSLAPRTTASMLQTTYTSATTQQQYHSSKKNMK